MGQAGEPRLACVDRAARIARIVRIARIARIARNGGTP